MVLYLYNFAPPWPNDTLCHWLSGFFTHKHGIVLHLNILEKQTNMWKCYDSADDVKEGRRQRSEKFTLTFGSRKLRSFIQFSAPISLILHWQWIPLYFLRCFYHDFTHLSGYDVCNFAEKRSLRTDGFYFFFNLLQISHSHASWNHNEHTISLIFTSFSLCIWCEIKKMYYNIDVTY